MLELHQTTQFKKDLRQARKRHLDLTLLDEVIAILLSGEDLPSRYGDHILRGKYAGLHECHIQYDWLFIYVKDERRLVLIAYRTGTHSDLLDK